MKKRWSNKKYSRPWDFIGSSGQVKDIFYKTKKTLSSMYWNDTKTAELLKLAPLDAVAFWRYISPIGDFQLRLFRWHRLIVHFCGCGWKFNIRICSIEHNTYLCKQIKIYYSHLPKSPPHTVSMKKLTSWLNASGRLLKKAKRIQPFMCARTLNGHFPRVWAS